MSACSQGYDRDYLSLIYDVVFLKHLKFVPSQLHPRSYAYMRIFQLCVNHKSWKSSLGLFLNMFHLKCSSPNNLRDQGLISLYPKNSWFDPFTQDSGDFMGNCLLVRPLTLEVHLTLFYSLIEYSYSCRSSHLKCLSSSHFNWDVSSF